MHDRADDTGQDDLPVLQAVDPAMVKDGDELDNYRRIISTHADDTTKPTDLENNDNKSVREVTQEGNSNGTKCDGGHPDVGEEGEEGTDIRVNLAKGTVLVGCPRIITVRPSLYFYITCFEEVYPQAVNNIFTDTALWAESV